ncbi:FAD-binding and (Fe-S)-binding domain-containing protein [Chromobacterium haemolyticum]|uniref:FAD-binding and (Fe-S)-binding domain-containing protein n=1 Tax=Chromobacterium haemolyticum TaxID=394935 RepID=UPI0009F02E03|nr:FAD-binding and (Fe-S)-binding domain-containing protein [Chromobacterium haemolyticum]OQS41455.1 4Fe-4S ferredoxin [Chromobacterium haemolyticum]
MSMSPAHQVFHRDLLKIMPATRIYTDPLSTLAYGTDASFYRLRPQIVARVDSEAEVAAILALARRHRVALTFRAAGTSLSGQAVSDSVLVLLGDGFNHGQVLDDGARVRLGPAMIGSHANALLAPYGRKIGPDPASINSAKIGGIAANNSSGMCCGTRDNSYHTLAGMRLLLLDGAVLDTGDAASVAAFRQSHAALLAGLSSLAAELHADAALAERVRRKYRLKNTTGYGINALLDFDDPVDMLSHLLIGSEGTLGFISEITFHSVIEHPHKASALLLFDALEPCCRAVSALSAAAEAHGVAAVELIDSRSLRALHGKPGLPDFLARPFGPEEACLLIEARAGSEAELARHCAAIDQLLAGFAPRLSSGFSREAAVCDSYWALRKGLFPAVGAVRPLGSTVVIEDVAFPIPLLADGVARLTALFDRHGYHEALLFGHALDGNLHFVFAPSFDNEREVARYDAFMQDVSALVAGEYDGSLKAEHGTGRNVAPFVRQEWGDAAWHLMRRIKALFDPDGLLNPGVIITDNERLHLENLKPLPAADPIVDRCIECGFCEAACPSHGLTLSPRQRIVAWRRIQQLSRDGGAGEELAALRADFRYRAIDTCAATGMCATRCPVGINTGELMKRLQGPSPRPRAARFAARHIGAAAAAVRAGLRLAHLFGPERLHRISLRLRRRHKVIPLIPAHLPRPAGRLPAAVGGDGEPVVLFLSCVNRALAFDAAGGNAAAPTLALLRRAGFSPRYPHGHDGLCCGQPFASANAAEALDISQNALNRALLAASEDGRHPVYLDNGPCAARILSAQRQGRLDTRLRLFDAARFLEAFVAPRLAVTRKLEQLALHIPCSAAEMGAAEALTRLAGLCAERLTVPDIACCGFAGDKGFTVPELNAHSLRRLPPALPPGCRHGVSMSRTCQIGLSEHAGFEYRSIEALLDFCTTPGSGPL